MDNLPAHSGLEISCLSRCFRHVVNSYKFYWFLGILDHIAESDEPDISFDELALRMLSGVWYPLDYYKLSFGTQDSFKLLARQISAEIKIDNHIKAPPLLRQMEKGLPPETATRLKKEIKDTLMRWVSYRFLSPFFSPEIKGLKDHAANKIIKNLGHHEPYRSRVPYVLHKDSITLTPDWAAYFRQHQQILRGFIHWHLVKFLQRNNPNVIGLTEKLEKPQERDLKIARDFWRFYIEHNETRCIYSGELITKNNYSLDHFIPWSYIAHDQLWNIVPTSKSINSSKGDQLPSLPDYMQAFSELQHRAYHFHLDGRRHQLLADYGSLFRLDHYRAIPLPDFRATITPEIAAHYRIAENLGFRTPYLFEFKNKT